MFDDEDQPKKPEQLKNLENLSIDELEDYIEFLKSEITRTQDEITKKKSHHDAAAAFFK
ncbi:MAG: DUF1192 domain-containing protein [Pseudomonadota bacterium]